MLKEREKLAELLANLDAVGRRAAMEGDPTADEQVTQEETTTLETTISDQEAWKVAGNAFWGNYLARITQYTLMYKFGDNHTILQEARRWSMARMLGWFRNFSETSRVTC